MTTSAANKRIAKNTLFLYIRLFFVMIVNLYTTRIVLDVLGVSDYGIYNVVCGFVAMFGFLNTSMSNAIQRFYNFECGKNGSKAIVKVYNTALIIQIILAIIVVALTETIGLWYLNYQMVIMPNRLIAANWIFQFSIISLAFVILQIPYSAAVLAYEQMNYFAVVSVLDSVIKLAIVVMLPSLPGDSLIIYGVLIMCLSIVNFLLYFVYCRKKFMNLKYERLYDKDLLKSMLGFSGWNLLGSFAYIVKGQGINLLLNFFFGTVVNAANAIATQVSSAIQTFSSNLVIAFKPQLTQSYAQGNYVRAEQLLLSMSKISYALILIIAMPIIAEIDLILKLWLKSNIPDYTSSFVILTIVSMMISVLNTPITQMIHASGKMKLYQITTSLIICSILPISWIFLKLGYDAYMVFFVVIFITVINQVACLLVLHKIFKFEWMRYLREVIYPCIILTIATTITILLINNLMNSSVFRLIIVFVLTGVVILALLYLTMNPEEKNNVKSFLSKIFHKKQIL